MPKHQPEDHTLKCKPARKQNHKFKIHKTKLQHFYNQKISYPDKKNIKSTTTYTLPSNMEASWHQPSKLVEKNKPI